MFYLQYLSYVVGKQLSLNSQGNNVSCKQPGFNSHQRLYELVIGWGLIALKIGYIMP